MSQLKIKQLDLFADRWPKEYDCNDEEDKGCCSGCHYQGLGIVYNKHFLFCCQTHPSFKGNGTTPAILGKLVRRSNGTKVF
jgi:hypothetical protein